MTTGRLVLITVLAGAISIGFAIFGQRWLEEGEGFDLSLPFPRGGGDHRLGGLPDFQLPDTGGSMISSRSWAGKVVVLNFWATWCPPCRREIPLLIELQEANAGAGLQVVGIAIDNKEEVEQFLGTHPVNYPILLGDIGAIEMSRGLGNRLQGLPFTAIFDRTGKPVHGQVGEMTSASLSKYLEPLLPQPTATQTTGN